MRIFFRKTERVLKTYEIKEDSFKYNFRMVDGTYIELEVKSKINHYGIHNVPYTTHPHNIVRESIERGLVVQNTNLSQVIKYDVEKIAEKWIKYEIVKETDYLFGIFPCSIEIHRKAENGV